MYSNLYIFRISSRFQRAILKFKMNHHNKSAAVVDMQFVVGNNAQLFVKEIVILPCGSFIPEQYYLKPPYPREELNVKAVRQENYNARYINGLRWDGGNIEYNQLAKILLPLETSKIYVKGEEKAKFLRKYLPGVEIIDLNIPKLSSLDSYKIKCNIHAEGSKLRCAMQNCFNIYMHLVLNKIIL